MALDLDNLRELTRPHFELARYLDDDDPSRDAILTLGAAVSRLVEELEEAKATSWAEGYKAHMRFDAEGALDPMHQRSWLDGLKRNPYSTQGTPNA